MEQKKRTYGQKASPAVEAPAEDTVKVRSLRLSDDTVEELNAAKKALDVRTMDKAMQAILDTFSMSMAKDAIPERATEIGEFEVLCRRLVDAYTHSLILCHDAEERAQELVRAKMDDLNSTISQLTRMQAQSDQKIHELEGVNQKLVAELRQAIPWGAKLPPAFSLRTRIPVLRASPNFFPQMVHFLSFGTSPEKSPLKFFCFICILPFSPLPAASLARHPRLPPNPPSFSEGQIYKETQKMRNYSDLFWNIPILAPILVDENASLPPDPCAACDNARKPYR